MPIIIGGLFVLVLLWMFLSWFEETILNFSNSVIETLTPTGVSLMISIVIFIFSIKYIKLMTQILGAFFTKNPSAQKIVAIPVFIALIVAVAFIKGANIDSYTKNVKDFYMKSNKFVEKTSFYKHRQY